MNAYATVHYSDSTGRTVLVVNCESETEYRIALDEACRWAEEIPGEDRRVWGHICGMVAA